MRDKSKARLVVIIACVIGALVLAFSIFSGVRAAHNSDVGRTVAMTNGSTVTLRQTAFTGQGFNYNHQSGNRWLRLIAPILPQGLRNKLNLSGGSMSVGSRPDTNLFVVTITRGKPGANTEPLGRLRVVDDQTNSFDASWGASTLGMEGETANLWQISSFPRRSPFLHLQFLAVRTNGDWVKAAEFQIPNPAFGAFTQWTAQPLPLTSRAGDLAVTLKEFRSGQKMAGRRGRGDDSVAARKTRLLFTFAQNGVPSDDWRVQKVAFSDAPGNHWFPYLDFIKQDFSWTTNGTVELFGALWPGENAWKLDVEFVRTAGFEPNDLWETSVAIPRPGTLLNLTNRWESSGTTVELIGLAAPNREFAGDFRWIAKWWGESRDKVFSLAVKLGPDAQPSRLTLVRAVDQNGAAAKLMQHGNQDDPCQVFFLKPGQDATELRLTLALQRSRSVQFVARPDF